MKNKIGILTYHKSINYGAFLQSYALQNFLKQNFSSVCNVEIIDYESKKANEYYIKEYRNNRDLVRSFIRSQSKLNKSKEKLLTDDIPTIIQYIKNQKYDLIIVGSDEIWKIDGMRGFPNAYWLNPNDVKTTVISYGASSRSSLEIIDEKKALYINKTLDDYEYIGVRDYSTKNLIEKITNKKTVINCDPVFLFDFGRDENYKLNLYKKYSIPLEKKLFIVMIPDERLVQLIKREFGENYFIISVYDNSKYSDVYISKLGPFEWIKVISCGDYLVTNRFHGTAFAIKYNVPFLSLDNYDIKANSKLYDMLSRSGLEENYNEYKGYQTDDIRRMLIKKISNRISRKVDYEQARNRLLENKDEFLNYIKEKFQIE